MKILSPSLQGHVSGEVVTLATCWKLTRRDSTVMGFTDHDHPLEVEGVLYAATTGFTPSAISGNAGLAVDHMEIEGLLDSAAITEEDIHAGRYDYAAISVFMVNYEDVSQGILSLRNGWLGEVRLNHRQFVAEVRGLMQQLSQGIGSLYSSSCRANLGDNKCKIALAAYTVTGSITAVSGNVILTDQAREEASGYFNAGKITFTSGLNTGLSMEVKNYAAGGVMTLVFPMPYAAQEEDSYVLHVGCDKTFATCISRFNNAVNFRGEPHVPGIDRMLETSATRTR